MRNLPSRKPQLWERPWFVLRRKVMFSLTSTLHPSWLTRATVTALYRRNLTIEVVPGEVIGRYIYMFGLWEIAGTHLIQHLVQPGDIFIDVGANIGYYSLLASDLVRPNGHVYAFECCAPIHRRLTRNVAMNRLNNITIRPEAVAQRSGVVAFYPVEGVYNDGASSTVPGPGKTTTPITVPAISLDDFARAHPHLPLDILKIDVEGGETAVLAGAKEVLASDRAPRAILLEVAAGDPIFQTLSVAGYTLRAVSYSLRHGLEFIAPDDVCRLAAIRDHYAGQGTIDYLAVRGSDTEDQFAALARRSRANLGPIGRAIAQLAPVH